MTTNSVTHWFGEAFTHLHPLLQQLHQTGGQLSGTVTIELVTNPLARLIGQRLAKKLGIPTDKNQCPFQVEISHTPDALLWSRQFGTHKMISVFKPIGTYPTGHWLETTGAIQLQLGVDISQGGWTWVTQALRFKGVSLPLSVMPRTHAYKRIEEGQYRFGVEFSLPVLGKLLSYSGLLHPSTHPNH